MHKFIVIALLCWISVWSGNTLAEQPPVCQRPLNVAWNEYPPYAFRNTDGTVDGFDIRILRQISQHLNCPLIFIETPPQRTFASMRHGRIDITAAASRTKERELFAFFSVAYRWELMTLFSNTANEKAKQIERKEDLPTSNMNIAVVRGAWYGPYIDQLRKSPDISVRFTEIASPEGRFLMLLNKRTDLVVADALSADWSLSKQKLSNDIRPLPVTVNDSAVHLMFSRTSVPPAIVEAFNNAILTLTQSNAFYGLYQHFVPHELRALYERPLPSDVPPTS